MKEYTVEMRIVKYVTYQVRASNENQAMEMAEDEAYLDYGNAGECSADVIFVEESED